MSLHLSRLTLKRSPEIGPIIKLLQPEDSGSALEADHRLVWSVMPEAMQKQHQDLRRAGKQESPFLWRREPSKGCYFLLGPKPSERTALFDIETKPFEARLAPGDRLQFLLRVHATVDRRVAGRDSRQRSDVVIDLLHKTPPGGRAELRQGMAEQAAEQWLRRRGEADGFALDAVIVDGYHVAPLSRERKAAGGRRERAGQPRQGKRSPRDGIGILDLRGVLTMREPDAFLQRLEGGFGRAKAFGCGLMLIRRTP